MLIHRCHCSHELFSIIWHSWKLTQHKNVDFKLLLLRCSLQFSTMTKFDQNISRNKSSSSANFLFQKISRKSSSSEKAKNFFLFYYEIISQVMNYRLGKLMSTWNHEFSERKLLWLGNVIFVMHTRKKTIINQLSTLIMSIATFESHPWNRLKLSHSH